MASDPGRSGSSLRTAGAATLIGSTVEYYDFFVYATAAALVFPQVFFAGAGPFAATLASYGSFAAGYLARPLGAVVFGHLADRHGRRSVLVASLVLMGVTTTVIGLLPGTATLGPLAPVLLVALRVVQGIAYGGEGTGGFLVAYEYAPARHRTLMTSLPATGPAVGVALGTSAFLAVGALLPADELTWGWRLPFLVSPVLVLVGVWIRRRLAETPEFTRVRREGARVRLPVVAAVRRHPAAILLVAGALLGFGLVPTVTSTYLVGYATARGGIDLTGILLIVLIANAAQVITMPAGAALADRHGPAVVVAGGGLATTVGIFGVVAAVEQGGFGRILLAYLLVYTGAWALAFGAVCTAAVGAFAPAVRYSGFGLGAQTATVLGTALGPANATLLVEATGGAVAVAAYVGALVVVSTVCVLLLLRRSAAPG